MKGTGHTVEELIRLEAYLLSEKAGHPAHMERKFWVQAEAIVKERLAAKAPKKAVGKTAKAPAAAIVPAKKPAPKVVPAKKPVARLLPTPEAPAVAKPATKKTGSPRTAKAEPVPKATAKPVAAKTPKAPAKR